MRNKIRYIRLIGLIFVLIVGSSLTFAQNKSKRKSAKKPLVEVVSIVTDEKGNPLKNVSIICGEGAVVLYTDAKGRFQTKVENDATVMAVSYTHLDVYKRQVAINSTSKPGADKASLLIRGKSTWGEAEPLVLVDGIERDLSLIHI